MSALPVIAYAETDWIVSPNELENMLEVMLGETINMDEVGRNSCVYPPFDPLTVIAIDVASSKLDIRAYFKLLDGNTPAPGFTPFKLNKSTEVVAGQVSILWSTLLTFGIV